MPTLAERLEKAKAALEKAQKAKASKPRDFTWYGKTRRADQYHGDDATLRGLEQKVRHLQSKVDSKKGGRHTRRHRGTRRTRRHR